MRTNYNLDDRAGFWFNKVSTPWYLFVGSLLAFLTISTMQAQGNPVISIPFSGSNTVACGNNAVLLDNGGTGNYAENSNGYTVLESTGAVTINISGSIDVEDSWDYIYIYNGSGTGGTLLQSYTGTGNLNYTGAPGQTLTIQFVADEVYSWSGFSLDVTYTGACAGFDCTGPPAPGNTLTSAASTCSGTSVNLSLQNAANLGGMAFQWQSATAQAGPYSNIAGATAVNYTPSITAATWFRANVTCQGTTTASTPVSIGLISTGCYCIPAIQFPCQYDMVIASVQFNAITNYSGYSCNSSNGVVDYTSNSSYTTTLKPGSLTNLNLSLGINSQGVAAWIDFNDDGQFDDSERIINSNDIYQNYAEPFFPVYIRCDAPAGPHRLRIRTSFNTPGLSITPCGDSDYGEVEDYKITIGTPGACGMPAQLSASNVTTTTASLSWVNICGGDAWEVVIQPSGNFPPTGSGTPVSSLTYNATALESGFNYDFYVRTVCSPGSYSDWSNPVHFQTTPAMPGFGNGVWNVSCYNGSQLETFAGYYVDNDGTSFNTSNYWPQATSPSNASNYIGAPIDYDAHAYSAKRKGFSPGCYSITVINHDDDTALYIDGVMVFQDATNPGGHNDGVVWSGQLDANSEIEIVTKELGGNSQTYYQFYSLMQTYYADADGDGYGDPSGSTIEACSIPAGYSENWYDCNDANAAIHPGQTEILSNGIDENCNGMFDDTPSAFAPYCSAINYTGAVEPITSVNFAGIDNASSGTVQSVQGGGIPIENFISITGSVTAGQSYLMTLQGNTDGNYNDFFTAWIDWDQDGVFNTTTEKYYIDSVFGSNGNDGISTTATIDVPADALSGTTRMRIQKLYNNGPANPCSGGNYGQTEDYSLIVTGNCIPVTWYADADGDGAGNPLITLSQCLQPAGYVRFGTDCDDTNPLVYNLSSYYIDADIDGYTSGASASICYGETVPAGYLNSLTDIDCDDNNAAVYQSFPFYMNADGDAFGTGELISVCAVNANTPPVGYSLNNTDCDDNNHSVFRSATLYVDADFDGYTSGATQVVCYGSAMPIGFVGALTAIDCNDSDAAVYRSAVFYVDADHDGYTSGVSQTVCYGAAMPSGFVAALTAIDCNDTIAAIHPNATEIPLNGVDDNCNGSIDEGSTPVTTSLLAADCNATLASIGSLIGIQTLAPGLLYTGYRIRATLGSQVQVIEKIVPHFTMQEFASYAYATTYTIDIQLQRNGVWLGYYGPTCQISTPAILVQGGAAQVSPSQCGITLPKINTLIATTSLAGVSGYRFRVTNLTDVLGPNAVQTIDRTQNWFSLQMLTRYNYGTTYRIEVSVKSGTGAFGGFGSPCEVSSPPAPSLVNCGGVVASGTAYISATSLAGVTQYRFQITRQSDLASATIDRNTNYFTFNSVPATISSPGVLYALRVAVYSAGTWSPFGDACEITSPGTAARVTTAPLTEESTAFKATAYPNPFTSDFSINVTTSSSEDVILKIYDMLGKLIESREVKIVDLDLEKIGMQYPSGVYNVIVSQNGIVKTLRVIKR